MKKRNIMRAVLIIGMAALVIGGVILYGLSYEKNPIVAKKEETTTNNTSISTHEFIASTPLEELYLSFVAFENETDFPMDKIEVTFDGGLKIVAQGYTNMLDLDGDDHTNQPDLRQLWVKDIEVENTSDTSILLTQDNFTIDINGVISTAHVIFNDDIAGSFDSQSFPCSLEPGEKRPLHLAFGFTVSRTTIFLDGDDRIADELRDQYAFCAQIKANYNGHEEVLSEESGSAVDIFRDKPE